MLRDSHGPNWEIGTLGILGTNICRVLLICWSGRKGESIITPAKAY